MAITCSINTDGGSRGNPGPAAFGYVLRIPGSPPIEEGGFLPNATNNFAEYTAVIRALQHALELGVTEARVLSDSELMVKQMNGVYKVKNANILPLYRQIQSLLPYFDKVTFKHIYREENSQADQICNDVMDDQARGIVEPLRSFKLPEAKPSSQSQPTPTPSPPPSTKVPEKATCPPKLQKQAVAYLQELFDCIEDGEVISAEEAWTKLWEMTNGADRP